MKVGMSDSELQSLLINGIYEASPEGIIVVDDNHVIVSHNHRFVQLWQIPSDLLHGLEPGTAIGLDDAPILSTILERVKDAQVFLARVKALYDNPHLNDLCEIELLDGRTVERHSTALKSNDGLYLGRVWFFRDVTERKKLERSLRLTQFTVDWAQDAIFRIDQNARIQYVNIAACQHLGYFEDELLMLSVPDINPDFSPETWADHWKDITNVGWKRFETHHKRKDGTLVPVEIVANFINLEGEFIFFSFVRNISERKQAEEEIRNLAFYDSLTKLPNRRLLLDRLSVALLASAREHQYGALLFLDMDRFKMINDMLGHDYGDLLLIEVATRIKSCVREVDTVARFAGDEFIVLLEETGVKAEDASQNIAHVTEKIRASLAAPYQLKEHTHHGSSSIGVCLFKGHEKSVAELIKCADIAMYQAKNSGRNTVRFFDPLMQ